MSDRPTGTPFDRQRHVHSERPEPAAHLRTRAEELIDRRQSSALPAAAYRKTSPCTADRRP